MPNFKSISFKMTVLQGAGRICPPHVCVIQKTPCGIGLRLISNDFCTLLLYGNEQFIIEATVQFIQSSERLKRN